MLLRLIATAGLMALSYYVGKQVGRMDPIRDELERARQDQENDAAVAEQSSDKDRGDTAT